MTPTSAFAVDPVNPMLLYVADVGLGQMMFSTDGGAMWNADDELTDLVTRNGEFLLQPTAIAFDLNSDRIVVGTATAGLFASLNNGGSWSDIPGAELLPGFRDFFFDESDGSIYAATRGRGIFRVRGIPQADLRISKSDQPDPVVAGEDLVYTVRVTNDGPDWATDVVVTDTLPTGVTYVMDTDTCVQGPPGILTCTLGDIPNGDFREFTIKVHVSPSLAPSGPVTIENVADVSSTTTDTDPADNSVTTATTVIARADLSISKLGTPSPVIAGTELTYELTATNLGPSDAQEMVVSDALPATTRFLSAIPSGGGTCTVPPVDSSGTVQCTYAGATSPGGVHSVTITVRVCSDVLCGTAISDTGTTSSATTDPNPSNNTASIATAVQSQSDLSIRKVARGIVAWGEVFEYTLIVHNAGVSTSHATTVHDAVPSQITVLTTSSSQGSCSVSSGTVTCDLGDLGAPNQCGSSFKTGARIVITARARPPRPGPVENTATVSSGNCLPDPNPDDNSSSTTTLITAAAPAGEPRQVPIPVLSPLAMIILALALGLLAARGLMRGKRSRDRLIPPL